MEYLTNRPESTTFSRIIPIFFLLLLLLRSFGLHANIKYERRYKKEIEPAVLIDRTPFNERVWWLDTSTHNEQLICSQRVGVFSEFYNQSPVECTTGRTLNQAQKSILKGVNKHAHCLTNGKIIVCQNPDGTVLKFDQQTEDPQNRNRRPRVRLLNT